ncbi:NmrA family NAD(P)-binding protein [Mycobacterium sherrisii]|uniref:NmrA family NAD(P)-binding protein n=1 Tax=Mycobacterium sherrisii TaxID=243061 RepID=UPI003976C9DC
MTEKQLLAVVGATGAQGGGLVSAILADPDPQFAVRALTRNPRSSAAQALAAAGAEVVAADLDDKASIRHAFTGAYGAYVVTNYWAPRSPLDEAGRTRGEAELAQANTAARAAKDANLAHVIWSTLEDTRVHFGDGGRIPTLEGRYKVPHFDAKAEANRFFLSYDVPTTFLQTTFYFEGFLHGPGPARNTNGALALRIPMADQPLAGIAVDDIGKTALGIFKQGTQAVGTTVSIAGDHLTGKQYAAAFAEALDEPVRYLPPSFDEFRAGDNPGAVEMANMFQFYAEDAERFTKVRDLVRVRQLNPQLQSFPQWLHAHVDELHVG